MLRHFSAENKNKKELKMNLILSFALMKFALTNVDGRGNHHHFRLVLKVTFWFKLIGMRHIPASLNEIN